MNEIKLKPSKMLKQVQIFFVLSLVLVVGAFVNARFYVKAHPSAYENFGWEMFIIWFPILFLSSLLTFSYSVANVRTLHIAGWVFFILSSALLMAAGYAIIGFYFIG